jgi:hypothetical protein
MDRSQLQLLQALLRIFSGLGGVTTAKIGTRNLMPPAGIVENQDNL